MKGLPRVELETLRALLELGSCNPTKLLKYLNAQPHLKWLDRSNLSKILTKFAGMGIVESTLENFEYLSESGLYRWGKVKYNLTETGRVYVKLTLTLLTEISPTPMELEQALAHPQFSVISDWLSYSIKVRDSLNPDLLSDDPLRFSIQRGTFAENLIFSCLDHQAHIKQVGNHFTSQDEEALLESRETEVGLFTWHTMKKKVAKSSYPSDWVILRVFLGAAPTFAIEKKGTTSKTLFYPRESQQRKALAEDSSSDAQPADPQDIAVCFAKGGYDRIVTQPPFSSVFTVLNGASVVKPNLETYFLVVHRSVFEPTVRSLNTWRIISAGRRACGSDLSDPWKRYKYVDRYLREGLSQELIVLPAYRKIARQLSVIESGY